MELKKAEAFDRYLAHLDVDTAREIADRLVRLAPNWSLKWLRIKLRCAAIDADPASAKERYQRNVTGRHVRFGLHADGTASIEASWLPGVAAAEAKSNIERLARAAKSAGDPRLMPQLCADAYLDLLRGIPFRLAPTVDEVTADGDAAERAQFPFAGVHDAEVTAHFDAQAAAEATHAAQAADLAAQVARALARESARSAAVALANAHARAKAETDADAASPATEHRASGRGAGSPCASGRVARSPRASGRAAGASDSRAGENTSGDETGRVGGGVDPALLNPALIDHEVGEPTDWWHDPWPGPSGGESFPDHLFPDPAPLTSPPDPPWSAPESGNGAAGGVPDDGVLPVVPIEEVTSHPQGGEVCSECQTIVTPAPRRGVCNIMVDLGMLMLLNEHPGIIPGWGPVIADVTRQLALDTDPDAPMRWLFGIVDSHGRLLEQVETRRRPDTIERNFIKTRDQTCRHPGCQRPSYDCDEDHRIDYAHGGISLRSNCGSLCKHPPQVEAPLWSDLRTRPRRHGVLALPRRPHLRRAALRPALVRR